LQIVCTHETSLTARIRKRSFGISLFAFNYVCENEQKQIAFSSKIPPSLCTGYLASRFSSSSSKHAHHSTPNVIQQERPSSAKSGNDSPAAAAEQRPPPPCSHQIELFAPSFSPVPDQKIEAKRVRGGGTNALCELRIKQASNISSSSSSGNNEHINNIVSSRRRRKRRSQYSIDVASDGTVMNIMEFADLPSALSLMQASNRIREALCGKLRHRFWEMTFWRDRGILLYFNQCDECVMNVMTTNLGKLRNYWPTQYNNFD